LTDTIETDEHVNGRCQMRYRYLVLFGAWAAAVAVAPAPLAGQAPRFADSAAAQAKPWTPPRTPWGDPDLQGSWKYENTASRYDIELQLPFQRPKELGEKAVWTEAERAARETQINREEQETADRRVGKPVFVLGERGLQVGSELGEPTKVQIRISPRTSAIIDPPNGRLPPWTPEAVKRWEAREAARRGRGESDSWEDRSWEERCLHVMYPALTPGLMPPRPPPVNPGYEFERVFTQQAITRGPEEREIFQAPGYVVMVMTYTDRARHQIIPLDGRPALGPKIRQFLGDSRGRWEGNTLVVETTNVNDQQNGGALIPSRHQPMHPGSGEALRIVERYTRLDDGTLEYRYTINDPEAYTRPWTAVYELAWQDPPQMVPLPATGCHEYNRGLAHFLAGARAEQQLSIQYAEDAARDRRQRLEQLKAEWAAVDKSR
jgi:hypothetical protein